MARWLVMSSGGSQYPVTGLDELRKLAREGRLAAADMIQPPGTNDWLYVSEVPELAGELRGGASAVDVDDVPVGGGGARALQGVVALVLLGVAVAAGLAAWDFAGRLPDPEKAIIGGKGSLTFSEMVVTREGVSLRAEPTASGAVVTAIAKDSVLELLAKRGEFYRARMKQGGAEGWLPVSDVMPMYLLGGGEVVKEYDPLYNPDRYVVVMNASWMQLPEQRKDQITIFQFMLKNNSIYDMADLVLLATIKDAKGHELEKVEFRVEGVVPAKESTMVGTIPGAEGEGPRLVTEATFKAMAESEPELNLSYNDGVEVRMTTEDFTEATIDIIELRAVPKGK